MSLSHIETSSGTVDVSPSLDEAHARFIADILGSGGMDYSLVSGVKEIDETVIVAGDVTVERVESIMALAGGMSVDHA